MPYTATAANKDAAKDAAAAERILEIQKFKTDIVYAISSYFYIYETRQERGGGWKPFKLWPKQLEYLLFLEEAYKSGKQEIVCEKCRDMGVSLLTLAWITYHWLVDPSFNALIGSRKEDLVKLMPGHDTLFAKIRDYLEKLPDWLLPAGYDPNEHFRTLLLTNPANGNTIRGDSCTEDFGAGPRASVVFRDESARWPLDTSENTIHTAQLNIDVSTVNGLNHFHNQAKAAATYGNLFIFEWRDNPNFSEKWYAEGEERARRKGQLHIWRREVDRSYRAGVEGQIYPHIIYCERGDYDYNPDWPIWTFWDYGYADMGYLGFLQRDPDTGDLYLIDEIYNSRVSIHWFAPFVPGVIATGERTSQFRYLPDENRKILEHRTWKTSGMLHFGDPTGDQKRVETGTSVFDELKKYGIRFRLPTKQYWQDMNKRQETAGAALQRLKISNRCEYFYDSFTQFVVPERGEDSQSTTQPAKGIHKWSHAPSAFEAFAGKEPPLEVRPQRHGNPKWRANPWQVAS